MDVLGRHHVVRQAVRIEQIELYLGKAQYKLTQRTGVQMTKVIEKRLKRT